MAKNTRSGLVSRLRGRLVLVSAEEMQMGGVNVLVLCRVRRGEEEDHVLVSSSEKAGLHVCKLCNEPVADGEKKEHLEKDHSKTSVADDSDLSSSFHWRRFPLWRRVKRTQQYAPVTIAATSAARPPVTQSQSSSSSDAAAAKKRKADLTAADDPEEGPSPKKRPTLSTASSQTAPPKSESAMEKFLASSHTLMACLREKKDKEKRMKEARTLQEAAQSCQVEMDDLDKKNSDTCKEIEKKIADAREAIRKWTACLEEQEERLQRHQQRGREQRRQAEAKLESIKAKSGFLKTEEMAALRQELQQMSEVSSNVKDALDVTHLLEDTDIYRTMQCPVCLEVPPGQVFSCRKCSNHLCQECSSSAQVTQCPSCRESFQTAPATRNVLAERFIASLRDSQRKA